MPTSSHDAARHAARVAARLAGRAELIHAALDAATHLSHAQTASLWLDDQAGGAVSVPAAAACPNVDALERAARDAAGRQLKRQEEGVWLVGVPLQGVRGGLAVAASEPERVFEPREIAVLATLGQQAGAAIGDLGGGAPFWLIAEGVFDPPPQAGWPDALVDGLLWLDVEGRLIRTNRAALELLEPVDPATPAGYPAPGADPAGQPLAALAPWLPAEVLSALAPAPPGAVSVGRLTPGGGPSGGPRALTLVALPTGNGRLILLSDAAVRASVRGFEAMVVSNAAHELRTPLTAIRAHAELIPDLIGGEPDDTANRFFEVIDLESQRMGGLLDDLRDALRAEGPSVVLHRPTRPEASA